MTVYGEKNPSMVELYMDKSELSVGMYMAESSERLYMD